MTKLIKTEKETITIIPTIHKLYAIRMLQAANIPFKSFCRRDVPEGIPIECTFLGQEFPYERCVGIQACVDSESLFKALEERQENSHKKNKNE